MDAKLIITASRTGGFTVEAHLVSEVFNEGILARPEMVHVKTIVPVTTGIRTRVRIVIVTTVRHIPTKDRDQVDESVVTAKQMVRSIYMLGTQGLQSQNNEML